MLKQKKEMERRAREIEPIPLPGWSIPIYHILNEMENSAEKMKNKKQM